MYDRSSMITVSIFFLSFLHFNSFSLGFHQQSLSVLRARYLLISSRCGTRLSFFQSEELYDNSLLARLGESACFLWNKSAGDTFSHCVGWLRTVERAARGRKVDLRSCPVLGKVGGGSDGCG